MFDATLLDAAIAALNEQPRRGRVHYADLAAALAARNPDRFGPSEHRATPHFTLWRTLSESDAFEKIGKGWFWYRGWGPATEDVLRMSSDAGAGLRATSKQLRARQRLAPPTRAGTGTSWVPFFEALADRVLGFQGRGGELIDVLEELRSQGLMVTPLQDRDATGARFLLEEIDPFTFIGSFCRGITDEARRDLLEALAQILQIDAPLPTDFGGLPLLNNQASWFIDYRHRRAAGDVDRLWEVFRLALGPDPMKDPAFQQAFDAALTVRQTNVNLTMALFWIRPRTFLTLDSTLRGYTGVRIPNRGLSFGFYATALADVRARFPEPLPDLSLHAWLAGGEPAAPAAQPAAIPTAWLVGAYWDGAEPADQTAQFLAEGIWQNGYTDRYLAEVRAMAPGDLIAIKASSSQKHDLPFDARGHTVSKITIKATGTIVKNHQDGRTLEVEWDPQGPPRDWYFYTTRLTVWRLRDDEEMAHALRRFTFEGAPQDYAWFTERWWRENAVAAEPEPGAVEPDPVEPVAPEVLPYGLDDLAADGVFFPRPELERALRRLESKRNLILQGAPGTGKSFLAHRLAYALMGEKAPDRVEKLLFHPSTTYEDVVRGLRPTPSAGGFELRDGPLWRLAERADRDQDRRYVLIIDEINRGNLAQIFGECLQLLEHDKRGKQHGLTPLYTRFEGERFHLPSNLFVIGTMNVADRSLAWVDFALRRRFAFLTLPPQFGSATYRAWLTDRGMSPALVDRIVTSMGSLNQQISDDVSLGASFAVGHSFFCPGGDAFDALDDAWFDEVVDTEVAPLLHEYWYDDPSKANRAVQVLLRRA